MHTGSVTPSIHIHADPECMFQNFRWRYAGNRNAHEPAHSRRADRMLFCLNRDKTSERGAINQSYDRIGNTVNLARSNRAVSPSNGEKAKGSKFQLLKPWFGAPESGIYGISDRKENLIGWHISHRWLPANPSHGLRFDEAHRAWGLGSARRRGEVAGCTSPCGRTWYRLHRYSRCLWSRRYRAHHWRSTTALPVRTCDCHEGWPGSQRSCHGCRSWDIDEWEGSAYPEITAGQHAQTRCCTH